MTDYYPEVREHGDRMTYLVRSMARHKHWHQVDLASKEYPGNGECTCKHFRCACHVNWKNNGGVVVPYWAGHRSRTRCRHIEAADEFLLKQLKIALIADRGI